jgi:hypothetical protein
MRGVMMGRVYFNYVPKFLKADSGIDDQTFRTAYKYH